VEASRLTNSSAANTYRSRLAAISCFDLPFCLTVVCGSGRGVSTARDSSCTGSESPIPSDMLEQDAQMFGFRDKAFPPLGIGSQQHMQIVSFNSGNLHLDECFFQVKLINKMSVFARDGVGVHHHQTRLRSRTMRSVMAAESSTASRCISSNSASPWR
jgi:hypothetical protein